MSWSLDQRMPQRLGGRQPQHILLAHHWVIRFCGVKDTEDLNRSFLVESRCIAKPLHNFGD